jgi:5-methylcytosine-specific restriction endonuclease McrA
MMLICRQCGEPKIPDDFYVSERRCCKACCRKQTAAARVRYKQQEKDYSTVSIIHCPRCQTDKPSTDFYHCGSTKNGYRNECKSCDSKTVVKYEQAHLAETRHKRKAKWRRSPQIRITKAAINRRRRAALSHAPINDFDGPQWESMKEQYGHRCVYCDRKMQRLTQDHIVPLSKGGAHTARNIVPACRSCNAKKGVGLPLRPIQSLLFLVERRNVTCTASP